MTNEYYLRVALLFFPLALFIIAFLAGSIRALWSARFERAEHIPTHRPTSSTRAIGIR